MINKEYVEHAFCKNTMYVKVGGWRNTLFLFRVEVFEWALDKKVCNTMKFPSHGPPPLAFFLTQVYTRTKMRQPTKELFLDLPCLCYFHTYTIVFDMFPNA